MSERSTREVLGWESCRCSADCDYGTPPGQYVNRQVAVDDMLAWLLAGRAEVVDTHSYEAVDGTLGHVVSVGDDGLWTERRAPTLHAALEAAVRAVAEATR